jgi:hypothetical protein
VHFEFRFRMQYREGNVTRRDTRKHENPQRENTNRSAGSDHHRRNLRGDGYEKRDKGRESIVSLPAAKL